MESVNLCCLVGAARGHLWRGAQLEEIGQIGYKTALAGLQGVQAHPQTFLFVENPENLGKIPENPNKIPENLTKMVPNVV